MPANFERLIPSAPFLLIQAVLFSYIFRRIARRSSRAISLLVAAILVSAFLFLSIELAMGMSSRAYRLFPVLWAHQSWLRTAAYLWLFGSSPAYLLFLLVRPVFRDRSEGHVPARRQVLRAAGALAVAAPFAVEGYGAFIGRLDYRVKEVDLPLAGLHHDLEGLRILQLSDIHLSPYLSEREFARMVDAANGLRAHLAVMTGDLISTFGDPLDACLRQLARVKSDAGMLGCLGNHEAYTKTEQYVTAEGRRLGIRFLRHESQTLRFGRANLSFAGIDFAPFADRGFYLPGVESLQQPDSTNILLSHNPDVFPEAADQGWHATLAGHTHGGQVTVEILDQTLNVARFVTPYVSGLYRRGNSVCYVTRGIGTIGIPARVGALPEITLLRLRKA